MRPLQCPLPSPPPQEPPAPHPPPPPPPSPARHLRSSRTQVRREGFSATQHSEGRALQPSGKARPGAQHSSWLAHTPKPGVVGKEGAGGGSRVWAGRGKVVRLWEEGDGRLCQG
jgi:hypothetical protein